MILVTGGAGYIGSHCVLDLFKNGYDVHILDNLSTGHKEIINSLSRYGKLEFTECDLKNKKDISNIFKKQNITAVLHFAACSRVEESVSNPQKYYENNICGTLNLLDAMINNNVSHIVFSSTASIYGSAKYLPIDEKHPLNPENPYGQTKLAIENILKDYDNAYGLKSVCLRYFNAIGADNQQRTGEWHEPETHLIPNILKSEFDKTKPFILYGDDYNTSDGTCIRDYIDVQDLVKAHILALQYLKNGGKTDCFNLGTATGYTVKEVLNFCQNIMEKKIKIKIEKRRKGDPEKLIAENKKAKEILGWTPETKLSESIQNAYKWIQTKERIYK